MALVDATLLCTLFNYTNISVNFLCMCVTMYLK
uniref:Uncharacterized protein n=1 Tax=Arundo donax TaxID=35708 RepID=A0A0A9BSM9_ARUDO